MKPPISTVIITLNEARNVVACIQAASLVSEEIIVLDSGSADDTVVLAENAGARVIQQDWLGYSQTKNIGNQQTSHDWILSLDADEVLSPELIDAIQHCAYEPDTVYLLNRLNNYCGHWVRYCNWYPDYVYRLFPKKDCEWEGQFVHEKLSYPTHFKVKKLSGHLLHYTYRTPEEHLAKIERYARLSAEDKISRGKNLNLLKRWFSPLFRFINVYLIHLGFLDGKTGFQIARREAYYVKRRNEWILTMKRQK